MKRLAGKVAVVAGAGSGIGRAVAVLFAEEGARVVVSARTAARIEETARIARERARLATQPRSLSEREGREARGEAVAVAADLTREADVERLFAKAVETYGGVDIVANTAGGFAAAPLERTEPETFEEMVALNLRTAFLTTRYGAVHLERRGGGAILNTSAAYGGAFPVTDLVAYNASKAGVVALTQSAAADLLAKNIRVNCIVPGILSHKYVPGRDVRRGRRLGRNPGLPEEVAYAALFLASDEAGWITGATLLVDGGLMVDRKRL